MNDTQLCFTVQGWTQRGSQHSREERPSVDALLKRSVNPVQIKHALLACSFEHVVCTLQLQEALLVLLALALNLCMPQLQDIKSDLYNCNYIVAHIA